MSQLPSIRQCKPHHSRARQKSAPPLELEIVFGLKKLAHDQIMRHIEKSFSRHDLARLVGGVLSAQGYRTEVARPGPDGGVDIFASTGPLGLGKPHLCAQVKSSKHPVDVETLRALQGTLEDFEADQGLLVAWNGFTRALTTAARKKYFKIRLWSAKELVEEIYLNYDRLPEDIKSELPLERVWILTEEIPSKC